MLKISNLSKSFMLSGKASNERTDSDPRVDGEEFHAVRDVSFSCNPGQVLGVLGLNGAGKTTTLRMLSTAIKPTSGSIAIDGVDVVANPLAMREQIGFLSGTTSLYHRLTVYENIAYFGKLHGMSEVQIKTRTDELFTILNMNEFRDQRAGTLSTGMKQRANIARAVIHDPRVLILDEPTTGLDVLSAKAIVDFIASYKGKNVPVLFSTHHLHEIEHLCDKVVFIHQGLSKFEGDLFQFKSLRPSQDLYDVFLYLSGEKSPALER